MNNSPEPWLRGTLTEVPAVPRAVLHAFWARPGDKLPAPETGFVEEGEHVD